MVWAGRGFGPALFLDSLFQRMASVRHLGLFPFCPANANDRRRDSGAAIPLGDGTLYPKDVPLIEAMIWYWRVRVWTVSASIEIPEGVDQDFPEGLLYEYSADCLSHATTDLEDISNEPEDEKSLVCSGLTKITAAQTSNPVSNEILFSLFDDLATPPIGGEDPFVLEKIF